MKYWKNEEKPARCKQGSTETPACPAYRQAGVRQGSMETYKRTQMENSNVKDGIQSFLALGGLGDKETGPAPATQLKKVTIKPVARLRRGKIFVTGG